MSSNVLKIGSGNGMKLTERRIRGIKSTGKKKRYGDGNGLYLVVRADGGKFWSYRFMESGKAREISLGVYPDVSLAKARELRHEAAVKRTDGIDIVAERVEAARKQAEIESVPREFTFRANAEELLDRGRSSGLSEVTMTKNSRFLFEHCAPLLERDMRTIKPKEVLAVLEHLEAGGKVHTAHRVRAKISEVYRLAIAKGRCNYDPTYALRNGAIRSEKRKSRAAITDEREFGDMLVRLDRYNFREPALRHAFTVIVHCYPRPQELRFAKWEHFDLDGRVWHVPDYLMKMRRPHDIPLSQPVLNALLELRDAKLSDEWVFPSVIGGVRPISENSFNSVLRRMGISGDRHCAHGFRSTASTLLHKHGFDERVIEASLAHQDSNSVRRAYNRYSFWQERVELADAWARIIADLKDAALQSEGRRMRRRREIEAIL